MNASTSIVAPVNRRRAFTLIELMMVVGIMALLAVMTATAINLTINGDKVRAGARQVQSFLSGARDRAIYAKDPRGVRFLLDPTNPRTVSSMVYIKPTQPWKQGAVQMQFGPGPGGTIIVNTLSGFDGTADPRSNDPTGWANLYNMGLLRDGAQIKIPNNDLGTFYTVTNTANVLNTPPTLQLTTAYLDPPTNSSVAIGNPAFNPDRTDLIYSLQLPPSVLPNQDTVLMPKGTVIDLDRCNKIPNANPSSLNTTTATLPTAWFNASVSPTIYNSQLDVMFSPRGTVYGSAASRGVIQFYVGTQVDADKGLMPEDPTGGDKVIVALFGKTGVISVNPVDLVDPPLVLGANWDYFKYAETGEVAGK